MNSSCFCYGWKWEEVKRTCHLKMVHGHICAAVGRIWEVRSPVISFLCLVKLVLQLPDILPHLCNARLNCFNRAGKTAEVKTIQNLRTGPKRYFSSHFLFLAGKGCFFWHVEKYIHLHQWWQITLAQEADSSLAMLVRSHNNLLCFWFAKCFFLKTCLVKWAAQANEWERIGTLEHAAEKTVNILFSHIPSGQTDLSFSFQENWIGWDHAWGQEG